MTPPQEPRTCGVLPERMQDKIVVDPGSACWLWTAHRDKNGYGRVRWEGGMREAHIITYQLLVGKIPTGLELDHLCRTPACVNPRHLEPVTHAENMRRGQHANSIKTHCKHGHEFDEANTRIDRDGHRVCRPCKRNRERVS